ncbi:MAG: RNA polymerase sigma factor [Candidatus Peribacteraceae bacterium]|jgi:RNA polymerase sigma-70 factor (ECF subfamily)
MAQNLRPLGEEEIRALVAQAQEGDTEAFGQVYDHFFLPIYRYTAFRAPEELTEDLVSEVFVKAWEKLYSYKLRKDVPFGAWLFRIARHTIVDAYRTQRSFDEVSEELMDTDHMNAADALTKQKDLLRTVRHALGKLPRRYREVLLLSYMANLSHEEVAKILRLTAGAVRILKFRALRKLQESLPPEYKEA